MPYPFALTEVFVSVQAAGPEPRHLAAGLLADNDLVLVPAPPLDLLDPDGMFEVVTIPQPLDADHPVERRRARCANVMWVGPERDQPAAVLMKLGQPSGYPPTMGPFDGATLAATLEGVGGNLWTALEDLGAIRTGLREGPPADVLAALPGIERDQRRVSIRHHEVPTVADIGWSLCRWLCICQPG